jgi:hypothetical protein
MDYPNGGSTHGVAFREGSRIWVVEYGPLDEQYVVQYRLSSQPGG